MDMLTDFKYVLSEASENGFQYALYYKHGSIFCKKLNYLFDELEEVESVAFYLQLWVDAGGKVLCSGGYDADGVVIGLDNTHLHDCPVRLSSQLLYVMHNGGYCPHQIAAYLLNLQPRMLDYYMAKHGLSYKAAGKLRLINIKEVFDSIKIHKGCRSLQEEYDRQKQRLDTCKEEYRHLMQLLPSLRLLFHLLYKSTSDNRNSRIFMGCLEGRSLAELGDSMGLTGERVRQIFNEQLKGVNKLVTLMTLNVSKQTALIARNALLEREVTRLRTETKLVRVEKALNLKPDKELREWMQTICRLLNTPLADMGFSTRTYNVLRSLNVNDVFHISRLDANQLENTRNSGKKTVSEVVDFCNRFHLNRLANPLYLNYIEQVGRELEAKELGEIGQLGFCPDEDGSVWLHEGVDPHDVVKQLRELAQSGFDVGAIDELDDSLILPFSLTFPEESCPIKVK